MPKTITDRRANACADLLSQVHAATARDGITPSTLHAIKLLLVELANRPELFPLSDFAMPEAQGRNHPLLVEENDGYGLYLTIGMPGKAAAPHDHGIWCVNAAVSGRERHVFHRRTDNGTEAGRAEIIKVGEVLVEPGTGMVMADHDIHSTEVLGTEPAIGLALYGYALARFPAVAWYHPEFGSTRCSPSRRHAGATATLPTLATTYKVTIQNKAIEVTCGVEQTVLQAAVAAGIDYPYACASGNCGICISKVDSGEVSLLPHNDVSLSPERALSGHTLACRARPQSDVVITWLGRGRR